MAIPRLLAGGADFLLASHTGSGKTLAYLLPLVHHIKGREVGGEPSRPRRYCTVSPACICLSGFFVSRACVDTY